MSDNPFRNTIDPGSIPAMIYCADARIGALLVRTMEMVGFKSIKTVTDKEAACEAIDSFQPRVVIIFADLNDAGSMQAAHAVNKKRVHTNRRTPKVLALMKPSTTDILRAKEAGFWDVLPLPATPQVLAGRLETVLTRLD